MITIRLTGDERPPRSVIQTSLVIKASRRREESGDWHLHLLNSSIFKATLRLRLIKQYQLIRLCPQATCVFYVRLTFRFNLVWWDLNFQSSSCITTAQWNEATTKFKYFMLYFSKLQCFITNYVIFVVRQPFKCCTTNQKYSTLWKVSKPSQQHMKIALKFDILHLIALQIVI